MHVDPFLIEPQRSHDRPRVRELLELCELPVDDIDTSPVDFLVMREAGQVVGAVGLETADGVGLLRSLAVLPSLHGQGRGGALVAAAERLAERRGIDDLYLLTTTVPGFFALHDYLRVQRTSVPLALQGTAQFASLCPSTAVCMHKRLRRPRL
ncbi:MAG: arsenic resistance N-acetyltransferase ArsN2 [Betaproteobacteria bacterium]|jgi:amino-acid N-acetyltransferase|nr:arsenic resistance N-acetyltransferase ArsN2 [Betaproteobacteria bacterium]